MSGSRSHNAWIKLKRSVGDSVASSLGDTIDGFIYLLNLRHQTQQYQISLVLADNVFESLEFPVYQMQVMPMLNLIVLFLVLIQNLLIYYHQVL